MPFSHLLWQTNTGLAQSCLDHPFVQGIGDGSLSRPRFAWYIGQDAFYLQAFARAYAIAAAKAPDWAGFRELHELAGGVLRELELHQGVATAWGLNLDSVRTRPSHTALHRFSARHRLEASCGYHHRRHDALHEAVRLSRPATDQPAARGARLQ